MNSLIQKKILFLILLNYFNVEASPLNMEEVAPITRSCRDPDNDDLEKKYNDFEADYRREEENRFMTGKLKSVNVEDIEDIEKDLIDDTKCHENDRNITRLNDMSVCPYQLKLNEKDGRYPKILEEAQCNCQSCIGSSSNFSFNPTLLPSKIYGCKPVFKKVPVLARGNCGNDGVYIWAPATAYLSQGCVCVSKHKKFASR